jgi:hypothetical protein
MLRAVIESSDCEIITKAAFFFYAKPLFRALYLFHVDFLSANRSLASSLRSKSFNAMEQYASLFGVQYANFKKLDVLGSRLITNS